MLFDKALVIYCNYVSVLHSFQDIAIVLTGNVIFR